MCSNIYISVTSMFTRQHQLYLALKSILKQSQMPDKIFLYLSEEPSNFDNGFINKIITNMHLFNLIRQNEDMFQIIWGNDIGPYGKLLPLLKEKWNEDCLIITIDDDTVYDNNLIKNMVNDYNKHKCVINYRGFTPKMNVLSDFDYNKRASLINNHKYNIELYKLKYMNYFTSNILC